MKKIITLLLLAYTLFVNAQDGTLDTSFGTNGKVFVPKIGLEHKFYSFDIDAQGKMYLFGGNNGDLYVYKYNTDGTLDTNFDSDGKLIIDLGINTSENYAIGKIKNSKIVFFSTRNSAIYRYNLDGTPDLTFDSTGTAFYEFYSNNRTVSFDATTDDNLYFGADRYYTEQSNPVRKKMLYSVLANGDYPNQNFNGGISFIPYTQYGTSQSFIIKALSNNQLLVIGSLSGLNYRNKYLYKYNQDGTLVSGVNSNPYTDEVKTGVFYNAIVDANDNVFICGSDVYENYFITKIKKNTYDLDGTFNFNGEHREDLSTGSEYLINIAKGINIHGNNIIVLGLTQDLNAIIDNALPNAKMFARRFDGAGNIQASFGVNGLLNIAIDNNENIDDMPLFSIINPSNNKLYVFTNHDSNNYQIMRINLSQVPLTTKETTKPILKLYPNPAKSQLNFSEELSEIKIVDMSGKMLYFAKEKLKSVKVENLPKGNYLISAKDKNGKTISEKFIKD